MTREEIDNTKYKVCCPMCENKICVKGTVSCEAEQWAKSRQVAIDLEELRHRFGNEVASVVEDMIKGTNERWSCSEKPNRCDDAISRTDVLSEYADWYGYDYENTTYYKHIKIMPSVSVAEKVGKWKKRWGDSRTTCPFCNALNFSKYKNFCPNCGAKMEVEE